MEHLCSFIFEWFLPRLLHILLAASVNHQPATSWQLILLGPSLDILLGQDLFEAFLSTRTRLTTIFWGWGLEDMIPSHNNPGKSIQVEILCGLRLCHTVGRGKGCYRPHPGKQAAYCGSISVLGFYRHWKVIVFYVELLVSSTLSK